MERCGLEVQQIVLEQLASSFSVLSDDEKDLGVCLVDIGGGTSDIVVFMGGQIVATKVIPVGGNHVTNDIAYALRTPEKEAEEIKGEGEAKAVDIYARAFSKDPEFYEFYRSLEAYKKIIDKKTTLVLPSNSNLFDTLNK